MRPSLVFLHVPPTPPYPTESCSLFLCWEGVTHERNDMAEVVTLVQGVRIEGGEHKGLEGQLVRREGEEAIVLVFPRVVVATEPCSRLKAVFADNTSFSAYDIVDILDGPHKGKRAICLTRPFANETVDVAIHPPPIEYRVAWTHVRLASRIVTAAKNETKE